jgi:3-oxoacyl-[acyl-carrier-protein] synthase II
MKRRVAVTGIGVVSPVGDSHEASVAAVREGRHGIVRMNEWDAIAHLGTRLAAPVKTELVDKIPRRSARTMGRVALLASAATQQALDEAAISREEIATGSVGLAYGSTHGSSSANEDWVRKLLENKGFLGLSSTAYLKFMSHTAATNLAVHFGFRGRILTTCAACVSASQAIGYAYENIANGLADVMVAGGAEELHFSHAGVFDIMYATSRAYNDTPSLSPRPFDTQHDGLVVGEGAGTFVLEEWERARAAGKRIHAEIVGFGTNCDGQHATSPSSDGMRGAMGLALKDARLSPTDIDYVNAHATGTPVGDAAESAATFGLFGSTVPVSSLKGHLGHTLGACGAIEAALAIGMLQGNWIAPTRNLEVPDPKCAALDYVKGYARETKLTTVMSNKFAFGGLNTSLVFKKA